MSTTDVQRSTGITYAAVTSVGMRRANNQDSHAVAVAPNMEEWQHRGHLFLVADGMGAHAAGELASKMAADGVVHGYLKRGDQPPPEALRAAIREMNAQIHERGESSIEFKGMGTTCSALTVLAEGAVVAHVGDSRVYRTRKGKLEQLSFDHSLVWELKAAGEMADADTVHLPKNIITRSLGPHANVDVDLEGPFPLEVGDTFLLCSDGLTGEIRDDEIGAILECLPPNEAAQFLVDLANLRGGPDNITAIVAKVDGPLPNGEAPPVERREPASSGGVASGMFGLLALIGAAVAVGAFMAGRMDLATVGAAAVVAFGFGSFYAAQNRRTAVVASEGHRMVPGRRYGRGPHTACNCAPTGKFVADLSQTAEQVLEAAKENGLSVGDSGFHDHRQQAMAAAESKDWTTAVREYSRGISAVMAALRQPAPRRATS